MLRYRADGAMPNEVLVGIDPGIRALTAAQAVDTDLLTQTEALPDYAVFAVPLGTLARARVGTRSTTPRKT